MELAPLADGPLVPQAVAAALGVQEQPQQSLMQTLVAVLQARQLLLVLDNCEHLLDGLRRAGRRAAARLPRAAHPGHQPRAAGHRRRGGLARARRWRCPIARRRAARRADCAAVGRRCACSSSGRGRRSPRSRLTDAERARRSPRSAPGWTASRWPSSWRRRASGRCRRRRSPRGWTTASACSPAAAARRRPASRRCGRRSTGATTCSARPSGRCSRRLAVFAGGWTLEAAEAVCAGEGDRGAARCSTLLGRLVDKSLVRGGAGPGGALRYRLLETIREYATERLERRGERDTLARRHRAWYLALGEQALQRLLAARRHRRLVAAAGGGAGQLPRRPALLAGTGRAGTGLAPGRRALGALGLPGPLGGGARLDRAAAGVAWRGRLPGGAG